MSDFWNWQPAQPSRIDQPVSLLRLEGQDSLKFLHGQTTAAVEGAAAGSWIGSCCTSPTGRMRAVVEILVDGAQADQPTTADQPTGASHGAWLVIHGDPETTAGSLRQALDRVLFPADRVKLGQLEPATLVTPLGTDLKPMLQWAGMVLPLELASLNCLGPGERERWRIQSCIPAEPGEINDNTNPFELGLADRVSLSKGCYLGQETLAKLATYDGVKQQLRRWHCQLEDQGSAFLLAPGQSLWGSDQTRAGVLTSSLDLGDGAWIGLALVRRQSLDQVNLIAKDDKTHLAICISQTPAA